MHLNSYFRLSYGKMFPVFQTINDQLSVSHFFLWQIDTLHNIFEVEHVTYWVLWPRRDWVSLSCTSYSMARAFSLLLVRNLSTSQRSRFFSKVLSLDDCILRLVDPEYCFVIWCWMAIGWWTSKMGCAMIRVSDLQIKQYGLSIVPFGSYFSRLSSIMHGTLTLRTEKVYKQMSG